jgi:hypothetical protein
MYNLLVHLTRGYNREMTDNRSHCLAHVHLQNCSLTRVTMQRCVVGSVICIH